MAGKLIINHTFSCDLITIPAIFIAVYSHIECNFSYCAFYNAKNIIKIILVINLFTVIQKHTKSPA